MAQHNQQVLCAMESDSQVSTDTTYNLVKGYDIVGGGENDPDKVKSLTGKSTMEVKIGLQWSLISTDNWKRFPDLVKQYLTLYQNGNMTVGKGNFNLTVSQGASFEDNSFLK